MIYSVFLDLDIASITDVFCKAHLADREFLPASFTVFFYVINAPVIMFWANGRFEDVFKIFPS